MAKVQTIKGKVLSKTGKKERFIEMRAEGWSYADIAKDLGVSKQTLIAWGRELRIQINNAKVIQLDSLFKNM